MLSSSASLLRTSFRTKTTTLKECAQAIASQARNISSSPYGRTHVWKRRPPVLPNPVVPKFPQRVVRSDGSTFTHWTTSPRSIIRLTRDTTNNPIWNTGLWTDEAGVEEEVSSTGRLGRFNRRFEGIGGIGGDIDWTEDFKDVQGEVEPPEKKADPASVKKKR